MKLFERFKNKETQSTEALIDEIKRLTAQRAYKITLDENAECGLLSSKIGGAAYFENGREYPADKNGEKMLLLCQINLSDVNDERLPKSGLLQFYIAKDGSAEGKTVLFESPDAENAAETNAPSMPCEGFSPVKKECALTFEAITDCISVSDEGFESCYGRAYESLYGKAPAATFADEKMCAELSGAGHKLFGYPCFVQCDPREDENDVLLLQLDSEFDSERALIMWGDSGVGNFFIKNAMLKKQQFEQTEFFWDCF